MEDTCILKLHHEQGQGTNSVISLLKASISSSKKASPYAEYNKAWIVNQKKRFEGRYKII